MIELEQAQQQAVQPAVDMIRRLEARVAQSCRWVLAEIRAHLTDPEYTVAKLRRDLGVSNNWLMSNFRKSVGLTPWSFIQEIRLETAARLLRDTLLTVGHVVILVGYVDLSSFVRLFARWSGLSPRDFRIQIRQARSRAGWIPKGVMSWFFWRRCRRQLTRDEVREVAAYLLRLYGPLTAEGILTTRHAASDRFARHSRFRRPYPARQSKPACPELSESEAAPDPNFPQGIERR